MQTIETFKLPVVPGEIKIELPARSQLFDAWETHESGPGGAGFDGTITVAYLFDAAAENTQEVTFYIMDKGDELADNFPGLFFKTIHFQSNAVQFLFFRTPYTKRKPIVVEPKLTDEQRAALDDRDTGGGKIP